MPYFISTQTLLMISYIMISPQTSSQLFLELEQARTCVASSLIDVFFLWMCDFIIIIFYYSIINLRWRPYVGMMGEEAVWLSQWVSLFHS